MMTDQGSPEKMRDEILADARKESEGILARAKEDAQQTLKSATEEADRLRKERLDQAGIEASRRSELILATVFVETGRLRAARMEALLESVLEEARRRLLAQEGFGYRETVIALAVDAISRMSGEAFVIKLPERDHAILGDSLADEIKGRIERPVNLTVQYNEGTLGTGVLVEDAGADQVWDNRLLKRLDRLWPQLRQQIAVEAGFITTSAKDRTDGGE